MAGGSLTVPQAQPEFPAEATTMMPAARTDSTVNLSESCPHPSLGGQSHELLMMWGALAGSPVEGLLPIAYGARKNSKHSMSSREYLPQHSCCDTQSTLPQEPRRSDSNSRHRQR